MNKQIKESELTDLLDELDPPYESKEELQIGRMLDQYGIPFFYRQPTVIYNDGKNEIWKPSFTLSQYGCLIIDYIAVSNDRDNQDIIRRREQIYNYNQIPATVLGPKDLDKSDWQQNLYQQLRHDLEKTSVYRI